MSQGSFLALPLLSFSGEISFFYPCEACFRFDTRAQELWDGIIYPQGFDGTPETKRIKYDFSPFIHSEDTKPPFT